MNMHIATKILKICFINMLTYYICFKLNKKCKLNFFNVLIITIASILTTILYVSLDDKINHIFIMFLMYIVQLLFLKIMIKPIKQSMVITNLIATAIVYIGFTISSIIADFPKSIFHLRNDIINVMFVMIIEIIIITIFFRLKRFNNGFSFLNSTLDNDYLETIMINVSIVVLFVYSLFENANADTIKKLLIPFIAVGIIMIIMIFKTLNLYYKHKLLAKTIEDYKSEIASKDEQIKKLSDEKFKISKLNHEFYNRQKALEKKVQDFVSNSNTETSSELSIMESISNLSKGYSGGLEKIKSLDKLPTTEIEEIDDMFKYMQSECKNNNIDFKLHVNGNIYHMVNKIIDKDKLVTLIGDHLRDAIIAVNSSTNTFRSIIATIGLHDKYYEFCVHDTGIEFEIDTLLKLGLEPTTTHKDTGGTGIGFITTFETLKETKGSLIIEEKHKMCSNDYTKTLIFRFDGKNEYKIYSYRADEIKKQCKDKRVIVKKLEYK